MFKVGSGKIRTGLRKRSYKSTKEEEVSRLPVVTRDYITVHQTPLKSNVTFGAAQIVSLNKGGGAEGVRYLRDKVEECRYVPPGFIKLSRRRKG